MGAAALGGALRGTKGRRTRCHLPVWKERWWPVLAAAWAMVNSLCGRCMCVARLIQSHMHTRFGERPVRCDALVGEQTAPPQ